MMDKNILEERLKQQSESEAFKEFINGQDYIRSHPVLRRIYEYGGLLSSKFI